MYEVLEGEARTARHRGRYYILRLLILSIGDDREERPEEGKEGRKERKGREGREGGKEGREGRGGGEEGEGGRAHNRFLKAGFAISCSKTPSGSPGTTISIAATNAMLAASPTSRNREPPSVHAASPPLCKVKGSATP